MKMNKLIFPLMIALVATMAATGCKKGPTKVTSLPGQPPAQVGNGDNGLNTVPSAPPVDTSNQGGVNANNNGIAMPGAPWDWHNMIQDRATLAAQTVHFAFDSAAIKSDEESKV